MAGYSDRNPDGTLKSGHKGLKPKGAISKKTEQWNELAESITTVHTERFNAVLGTMEDKDFLEIYLKVLEYFKPKLSRSEVKQENTHIVQQTKITREALAELKRGNND
jgi:hypothetical protein